jgi:hypothetical protein
MISAREYYYEKLKEYSSLYSTAIGVDSRVVADAWSTEFQEMTLGTEKWMRSVDRYVKGVKQAFASWEKQVA